MLRYLFVLALLFFSIATAQESENYAFTGVHVVSMDSDDGAAPDALGDEVLGGLGPIEVTKKPPRTIFVAGIAAVTPPTV